MNKQRQSNTRLADHNQASEPKLQSIKLGLDVHADSIVVVRILDHGSPQPAQRFKPEGFGRWVKTQLSLAQSVYSCYEAGPFGYVLHRQLTHLGVNNVVIQPVCLDEHYKGVKNDKRDARELAQRLDRYVSGNRHALATVRVPTPQEEQRRIESRQREQLKSEVKRLASEGRGLLLSQGYRQKRTWWSGKQWQELRATLPDWLRTRLEVFVRLLEAIEVELRQATRALEAAAPPERPRGMGGLTYEVIEREVGDWKRFTNRRQVGSYTGLCGGLRASGNSIRHLSITKHGNVRLRTALVEQAWRLVFWQSQCKLVRKWSHILQNPKASKTARKKAIVAIARQLAVDLWRWRRGKIQPQELGWTMVGQAQKQESSTPTSLAYDS